MAGGFMPCWRLRPGLSHLAADWRYTICYCWRSQFHGGQHADYQVFTVGLYRIPLYRRFCPQSQCRRGGSSSQSFEPGLHKFVPLVLTPRTKSCIYNKKGGVMVPSDVTVARITGECLAARVRLLNRQVLRLYDE